MQSVNRLVHRLGSAHGIGSGEKSHGLGGNRALTAAVAAAAGAIFLIDVSLPLGVAGGVPYVVVVLLGWWYDNSKPIFVLAAVSSALTAVGYVLSPEGGFHWDENHSFGIYWDGIHWVVLTNRALALFAIWVTAVLLSKAKSAEASLRASEARLAGILDLAPEAIISIDAGGHIQLFNQGAEAIFGYRREDVLGQPLEALLPPGIRGRHAEFVDGFARGPETSRLMGRRGEITALRKDGGEFPAEALISKLELGGKLLFTVLLRDITERRRAEESARQLRAQLTHAARLSTVGNMAAGLAHEINQPLSVIGNYAHTCIRALGSGEAGIQDALADLKNISRQVSRAADIVKWLRGAVTKEEAQKTELDLNACIREVTDFLEAEFRIRKCNLSMDLAVSLPAVRADKVQVQQVLLNLMQNGMEAASQGVGTGKGRGCQMKIRTSATTAGTVQTEIKDDGPGVPPEIRDNLFSPFVTTKTEGLGLGLSISKSIIEAHGGRIRATSNGRRGSTFAFTLPSAGGGAP